MKIIYCVIFLICGFVAPALAQTGHEKLPVVIWGHYMPQIPAGQLASTDAGNRDVWPFVVQSKDRVQEYLQQIDLAMEAGVNGFALLTYPDPDMFKAAVEYKKQTGKTFYLAPCWADLGPDPVKAAATIGKFIKARANDEHVFRIDGRQLHFTYNEGKWSSGDGPKLMREELAKEGLSVWMIPTVFMFDNVIMDRPDLGHHNSWDAFKPAVPGELKWLKETHWDGATDLNHAWGQRYDGLKALRDRITPFADRFLLVPSFAPGYDSSNRAFQATHCPFNGIRIMRDSLLNLHELGYRHLMLSTWNDANETITLPSTRSVWGYSHIIRYYHGLMQDGASPFNETRFVVSYNPDILLGDQLMIQFLVLPEHNTVSKEYIVNVQLEDINGNRVAESGALAHIRHEKQDALAEMRLDTSSLAGKVDVLVPYVSVRQKDPVSSESQDVYRRLRLAPIRLQFNRVQFPVPYAVALDRVAQNVELKLSQESPSLWKNSDGIARLRADVRGDASLRLLSLAESSLSMGMFRADDTSIPDGMTRVCVRVSVPVDGQMAARVSGGQIQEVFRPHWNLNEALQTVGKPECKFKAMNGKPVVLRITAPKDAELVLSGKDIPEIKTTLQQLADGAKQTLFTYKDKDTIISMMLATDMTDANIAYPISTGAYLRDVPLAANSGAERTLNLWGLTNDNRIVYSVPVAVKNQRDVSSVQALHQADDQVQVKLVRTHGAFDDFIGKHSEESVNIFKNDDIVEAAVKIDRIPYALLDFEETLGGKFNDSGTDHQLGRSWQSGSSTFGKFVDGWRGKALELPAGQSIRLRPKSMVTGEATLSMRLLVPALNKNNRMLFSDVGWQVELSGDGRIRASRWGNSDSEATRLTARTSRPIGKDWNHLAVVYDLSSVKIYLNGELAGESAQAAPSYRRSHSKPMIGGDPGNANVPTILLDQFEIIGTALNIEEIKKLMSIGQWKKQ